MEEQKKICQKKVFRLEGGSTKNELQNKNKCKQTCFLMFFSHKIV